MNDDNRERGVSLGSVVALIGMFVFGAGMGVLMASFLVPGSELALVIGLGVFPTTLLAGGFLLEELWEIGLWKLLPKDWHPEIRDSTSSPAVLEERRRAILLIPFGFLLAGIGGLFIGSQSTALPMAVVALAFAAVGFAYGGIMFTLIQFELLPRLSHGD